MTGRWKIQEKKKIDTGSALPKKKGGGFKGVRFRRRYNLRILRASAVYPLVPMLEARHTAISSLVLLCVVQSGCFMVRCNWNGMLAEGCWSQSCVFREEDTVLQQFSLRVSLSFLLLIRIATSTRRARIHLLTYFSLFCCFLKFARASDIY